MSVIGLLDSGWLAQLAAILSEAGRVSYLRLKVFFSCPRPEATHIKTLPFSSQVQGLVIRALGGSI